MPASAFVSAITYERPEREKALGAEGLKFTCWRWIQGVRALFLAIIEAVASFSGDCLAARFALPVAAGQEGLLCQRPLNRKTCFDLRMGGCLASP